MLDAADAVQHYSLARRCRSPRGCRRGQPAAQPRLGVRRIITVVAPPRGRQQRHGVAARAELERGRHADESARSLVARRLVGQQHVQQVLEVQPHSAHHHLNLSIGAVAVYESASRTGRRLSGMRPSGR